MLGSHRSDFLINTWHHWSFLYCVCVWWYHTFILYIPDNEVKHMIMFIAYSDVFFCEVHIKTPCFFIVCTSSLSIGRESFVWCIANIFSHSHFLYSWMEALNVGYFSLWLIFLCNFFKKFLLVPRPWIYSLIFRLCYFISGRDIYSLPRTDFCVYSVK